FSIGSTAFNEGDAIPEKYTCDGEDISPPLSWNGAPEGTVSYALVSDDPDAPGQTWVHWVIYNLPANVSELGEQVPTDKKLDNRALQGKNDFGNIGYGGPCPPGGTHRYFFRLYALNSELDLEPGATKAELMDAIDGRILEETQLMGRYTRSL
ncbi:MAG: YbhB/YbcL family Raf kinase inhibitor-like protein, partial [Balneolaceae bacterium]|nr:YbhB/YbcL family Raf kinase inhibitor-like protein [Balneolaceae bacterium]